MQGRGYDAELPVFELPVTIEDEQGRLGDRFEDAARVADSVARYGGLVNVLIHTDVLDHKLAFERQSIERFRARAHFDTVAGFGEWWARRDAVALLIKRPTANSRADPGGSRRLAT